MLILIALLPRYTEFVFMPILISLLPLLKIKRTVLLMLCIVIARYETTHFGRHFANLNA